MDANHHGVRSSRVRRHCRPRRPFVSGEQETIERQRGGNQCAETRSVGEGEQ